MKRPAVDEIIQDPSTPLQALRSAIKSELHCSMPGIVHSFDSLTQTATIQPAIRSRLAKEAGIENVQLPLLANVPVFFPGGGEYALTMPVQPGDECLVVFADSCIDAWWQSGGVQNQIDMRSHDISDGFAFVGFRSRGKALQDFDTNEPSLIGGTLGETGPEGKSAYEVWLEAGNVGTVADYLQSLRGPAGNTGPAGSDATVTKAAVEAVLTGDVVSHNHDSHHLKKSGDTVTGDFTVQADKKLNAYGVQIAVPSHQNLLANGDYRIWRRGTPITTQWYGPDRWKFPSLYTPTSQMVIDSYNGYKTYIAITSNNASNFVNLWQPVEGMYGDAYLTLSFWIKGTTARAATVIVSPTVYDDSTYGTYYNITTSWTKVVFTLYLPIMNNIVHVVPFRSSMGSGETVWIKDVKLEYGNIATPFYSRPQEEELLMCQKYYEKLDASGVSAFFASGFVDTNTTAIFFVPYSRKRATPTLSLSDVSHFNIRKVGANVAISSMTFGLITPLSCSISVVSTDLTAGQGVTLRAVSTSAQINIDSEI